MANPSAQIVIPLSKKKLRLNLVRLLVYMSVMLWFIIERPIINIPFLGNPLHISIIGIFILIIFGFFGFTIVKKLLDKKPGLIIDSNGIIDNSSEISAGHLLWSAIEDISVVEMENQKILMIEVKHPQDFIDKETNAFRKKGMQVSLNMYGSPFGISSNSLQIEFDELFKLLKEYLAASRH